MKKILILKGDGIGPEIIKEAIKVLEIIEKKNNIKFEFHEALIGGQAIDKYNDPLPQETIEKLKIVDAVLLSAIGGPKWENLPQDKKPEKGLLRLRKELNAFANLRPAKVFSCLAEASTLKKEIIDGIDLMIVRELTGGIYFGMPRGKVNDSYVNTASYSEEEIRRIVKCAAQIAMKRKKKLCSVDKANVLEVSQFWREITIDTINKDFPEIELSHMYVDNCAMQLIRNPKQFDTIVTSNLFGDILSDEASMLTGSIGLLASASIGDGSKPALFEPIHGSAPDIAGQNKANPIAMILSTAMMLDYSFNMNKEALIISNAVETILNNGYRTADLGGELKTSEIGDLICQEIERNL